MANMSANKNKMPVQPPLQRNKNFDEVALGYSAEQAIDEANRCLQCKHKPCVGGCPVEVDIPAFIKEVQNGEFEQAYRIIHHTSSLPAVCGRVCPQENQCEKFCVRGLKGEREILKKHAEKMGESVNGFIYRAVKETMARDNKE